MVKTEASHAFNIGSNPVRVTTLFLACMQVVIDGLPSLTDIVGADWYEGPPVPIPNTEVKLVRADNTWRVTAREDR